MRRQASHCLWPVDDLQHDAKAYGLITYAGEKTHGFNREDDSPLFL